MVNNLVSEVMATDLRVPGVGLPNILSLAGQPRRIVFSRLLFIGIVVSFIAVGVLTLFLAITLVHKPFPGFLVNQRLVVDSKGPTHWSGVKAGLQYPDKILKVNSKIISSANEIDEAVGNTKVGGAIQYSVQRSTGIVDVLVPTMNFTWIDFLLAFGITFLAAVTYFILGLIVFILKPNTHISWVFLGSCFLLSISDLSSFDIVSTRAGLIYPYLVSTTYCAAAIVHLGLVFPDKSSLLMRFPTAAWAPYLVSTVIMIPLVVSYPGAVFLWLMPVVLGYIALAVLLFMVATLTAYLKASSPLARTRARFILFGAAVALPFPAITPIVSFFGGTIPGMTVRLSALPQLIFPAFIAYSIARHNLFDVDVYIKRTVGYGLITAIVAIGYLTLQNAFSVFWHAGAGNDVGASIYPVVFALLVVFLFNPINRRVQAVVDHLFFRGGMDYKHAIGEISQALTSILTLPDVVSRLLLCVREHMAVEGASLILLNADEKCQPLFSAESAAAVTDKSANVCLAPDDVLLSLVAAERHLVTLADLTEAPQYRAVHDACLPTMLDLGAALVLPLIYKDRVTAVLAVGRKKSGHTHSREEVEFLTTVASQGAVALENARMAGALVEQERVQRELELAREIQANMLPKPMGASFPVTGINVSATEVSGDFFDFFNGKDGKIWFCLGDVSGKGVNAALLMSKTSSLFHCVAKVHDSPAEVLEIINNEIRENVTHGMFVTMVAGVYDPVEDEVCLANAGHQPPLLRSPTGQYSEMEADAPPLGILKDLTIPEIKFRLDGQTVYIYTDGLSEAPGESGEMLDVEGVKALIDNYSRLRPADRVTALVGKVVELSRSHVGKLFDDITLLVIERQV